MPPTTLPHKFGKITQTQNCDRNLTALSIVVFGKNVSENIKHVLKTFREYLSFHKRFDRNFMTPTTLPHQFGKNSQTQKCNRNLTQVSTVTFHRNVSENIKHLLKTFRE